MSRVSNVDNVAPENSPSPIIESTTSPIVNLNINDRVYEIFGHTKSPFSSSLIFPKVFSFAERDDNETILIALRPHWFTNVSWILPGKVSIKGTNLKRGVPINKIMPNKIQLMIVN